ncbi:hypothetical protein [Anoxybacteroides tepidamans]|uniref:hypothetical protein n=1 Tax=Anoxybacteroides tepidamans TaxID=265948 RepID=UPI001E38B387|nr:hypothetical protein [Anoxybacillus tepidamans]
MDKDHLLRSLAENGYNVSFGAKKHFATYDIVEKIPGFLALISLLIGVWQSISLTIKTTMRYQLL